MSQTPFAVRVTMAMEDGSTVTSVYVRGARRISRTDFASFALGDLMRLTGYMPVSVDIVDATNERY